MPVTDGAPNLKRVRATSSTDGTFASKIPTTTEPSGDGVVVLTESPPGVVPRQVKLLFFGAGADNTTFDARVIGWHKTYDGTNTPVWVPEVLAQFNVTLSAAIGIAGGVIVATDRLADTLVLVAGFGTSGVDVVVFSPVNDLAGHALVDLKGCQKLEVIFDLTGATNGNALYSLL